MQLGDLSSAVSEWSQLLAQAIVVPLRRGARRGRAAPRHRSVAPASGAVRSFAVRMRGNLYLATDGLSDELVPELIHAVGGRRARAVVLPAAAYHFATAGERYRRCLQRFGLERVETVEAATRPQAERPSIAALLGGADLVVLAGGDAALLAGVLRDTPVEAGLAAALVRGATVVTVGAACAAAGEWLLPPDPAEGDPAAPGGLRRGLGLLPHLLLACGSEAAARMGTVFGSALNAGIQALILDRRTVLAVRAGWQAEVRSGTVLAVGGGDPPPGAGTAPLGGVYTRVAPAGWRLDLAARVVLPPGAVLGAER